MLVLFVSLLHLPLCWPFLLLLIIYFCKVSLESRSKQNCMLCCLCILKEMPRSVTDRYIVICGLKNQKQRLYCVLCNSTKFISATTDRL